MPARFETFEHLRVDAKVVAISAEVANARTVSVQFLDRGSRDEMGERVSVAYYLADDVAGDTPATVAPSGGLAAGTDGAVIEWTANLSGVATSEVDGDLDITITEVGVKSYYLILVLPDGKLFSSGQIAFA
jgi:hypothetical protein